MTKWIVLGVSGFVFLVIVFSSISIVGAGQRGVVLTFGAYRGADLTPGLHFITPIAQSVVRMDIQTQKEQVDATAASKDLQNVSATVALNYHPQPESVGKLYQNIGLDYKSRIIDPAIQEAVKSVTSNFTAEELITRRSEVKDQVRDALAKRLLVDNITVDDFSIVNFKFSDSFEAAIEAKVTAEQNALAAKNKLEQVKYEADQTIAKADADAQAIKVKAAALQQNNGIVLLNLIEKWDGHAPTYMSIGTALPFISQLGK